ncbi:MAG: signal peptidase I [Muribaculaceae bacterium]|nr:signal peptidase I [Muribaculaceae bacterium]
MNDNSNISKRDKKSIFLVDLKQRLAFVRPTRWIRFTIVALIFIGWVVWMQSPWLLLFLFLLADIYLTQYIPWTWWKKSTNKMFLTIMSWVDAIVYALILVYFVFAFVGQNYQIPSSSLEKSLLVGDYLWVNKMVYGPRVPMTPLHFPLTQNTLPFIETKSYFDKPQINYKRLAGLRNIKRGDIVVFNFPAGDTVTLKVQNPDYYTLIHQYSRDAIHNNPNIFGNVIYRPVDRRENYVKRCLGLPGEKIKISNDTVYINGAPIPTPTQAQFNYYVQTNGSPISNITFEDLGISVDDRHMIPSHEISPAAVSQIGLFVDANGTIPPIYQLPLTDEMVDKLENMSSIYRVLKVPTYESLNVYPINHNYGWDRANMGEFWIPKKGHTLHLNTYNIYIYERLIRNYENNDLKILSDGTFLINGQQTEFYTFKMDYYWMMGDNRDNSADSRYWGFVPEDHIVGTPILVLISFDKDKNSIRFDRILRDANPDSSKF